MLAEGEEAWKSPIWRGEGRMEEEGRRRGGEAIIWSSNSAEILCFP